jgi:DNA-binding HxlR family transcriptional regulator
MVKRTSLEKADCPIARALDAIGDWWSLLIIRDALLGIRRFSEFQKNIGLAKNILAVRLRTLVDQGILKAAPASDGSAYQEYVLTPKGRGRAAAVERGILRRARRLPYPPCRPHQGPPGAKARTTLQGRPFARRWRYRSESESGPEAAPARVGLSDT